MTQQDDHQRRIIRKLADLELYHTATHLLGQYIGTVFHARYAIPSSPPHEIKALFESAIAQTVLEHPILQVGIAGEDSPAPCFVELPSVNLQNHIVWHHGTGEDVLQDQLDCKFTQVHSTPGWRIVVLAHDKEHLDVLFVWNHAICDGMGGKFFHQTLLHNLNSPQPTITNGILHLPPITTFTPAATSTKYPISMSYLATELWNEYKPSPFTQRALWAPIHASPYKTAFRKLQFDNAVLERVLLACRKHETTLTGLLHAIALVSLAASIPPELTATGFRSETPYDMRRFVPLPDALVMGNICCSTHHDFDKRFISRLRERIRPVPDGGLEEELWSVAQRVRGEIETALEMGTRDNILGLMKFVKDWRKQMEGYLGKPRSIGWVVTNLGVFDGNPSGDVSGSCWAVDEASFTLSAQAVGAAINIALVSVKGASLCVHLSWQDGVVDEAVMVKLVADVETWLRYLTDHRACERVDE